MPELKRHWSATVNNRLNSIQKATATGNIMKEWARFMNPMGYKLVCVTICILFIFTIYILVHTYQQFIYFKQ